MAWVPLGLLRAVEAAPGHAKRLAGGRDADMLSELLAGVHHVLSSVSISSSVRPSSRESFFWTSMMISACSRRHAGAHSLAAAGPALTSAGSWALRPRFFGGQALELSQCALLSPLGQMGRVQPFPAKERADLATLGAGVGLFQDAQLVLGR